MKDFDDLTPPTFADSQQSHALSGIIRQEIAQQGGIISFSTFMALALYHPAFGYYNTRAFEAGRHDFITAPEVSPLFAACFAQQCLPLFKHLNCYHVLEIGAGTGRFAADLLMTLEEMTDRPIHYAIYEISPVLRLRQQTHIKAACPHLFEHVAWLSQLPDTIHGIVIANEVLDALPVHCFRIGQTIEERGVAWENNQFSWQYCPPLSQALNDEAAALHARYALREGYESEINLQSAAFVRDLAHALTQGVILCSDYGYGQREYYHPERCHGTLTCFYQHRYHHRPLILPGLQDITSHVDFTRVIDTAADCGCLLSGYTSQASFLLSSGLLTLAEEKEKNLSPAEEVSLHHAIKLLTLPTEMGERVKVMALSKNIKDCPLLGFSGIDRRRDL